MKLKDVYLEIKRLRKESWTKVQDGKNSADDFVYSSFNFLRQFRCKPSVKAHDYESIMYNYLYWTIQIERKILMEKELVKINLGSEELLLKVLFMHIKRRDQMVRRLITEQKVNIKDFYLVHKDIVEIILENDEIIYSTQENLEKINKNVTEIKKSKNLAYLNLIKY